ncbi:MAG: hypothetical protein AAF824_09825 [Bacteroidota bacterium]
MKKVWFNASLLAVMLISSIAVFSQQHHVREEDHFWRKRVVNRISLIEKINAPLIFRESSFYGNDSRFQETEGIVMSIINGARAGKYIAYDPYEDKTYDFNALVLRMEEFEQALYGENEESFDEYEETDDLTNRDEFSDDFEEEWEFEVEDLEFEDEIEVEDDIFEEDTVEIDMAPYEQVIHMIEDWIFEKNSSRMIQEIRYFEIIWTDPTGTLPDKILCRFKYEDIEDQLAATKWKNRWNDSQSMSMKDAFAMRLFNGIMIDVGGRPVTSLYEAEKRRREMIEFEHHLWSY